MAEKTQLLTVGHSTRSLSAFIDLLRAHQVEQLLDVRSFPGSRRHPHFSKQPLAEALAHANIAYQHLPSLGGFRKPRADSNNLGWRNTSFRGYADYMQTPAFEAALSALMDLAAHRRSAIMCSEAVPWRCHRSLIADALTARGIEVLHIMTAERADLHTPKPFARIAGNKVTYPGNEEQGQLFD